MSIKHECDDCRMCSHCFAESCSSTLDERYKLKEIKEDGYIVKKCPYCGKAVEKFKLPK